MASSRVQKNDTKDDTQPPTNESFYDPLKPSTFVAPTPGKPYSVMIEFCDRVSTLLPAILQALIHNRCKCRWWALKGVALNQRVYEKNARLHRATWTSTELFLTFPPPTIQSITIVPLNSEDSAGRFRVWLTVGEGLPPILMWDRKVEGNFPELKILVSNSALQMCYFTQTHKTIEATDTRSHSTG